MLVAHDDLELLAADAVGFGPVAIVLLHDLRRGGGGQPIKSKKSLANPS